MCGEDLPNLITQSLGVAFGAPRDEYAPVVSVTCEMNVGTSLARDAISCLTVVTLIMQEPVQLVQNYVIPFDSMLAACQQYKPRMFWLSASHIHNDDEFVSNYRRFYESVGSQIALVVGGRALSQRIRRQIQFAAYCDNLQHLESLCETLSSFSQS
jgi:hypothetical protein